MMQLGARGAALIQSFEGLRLIGYADERGIPTIGWGHTGHGVYAGQRCTFVQAHSWFAQDTTSAVAAVNTAVTAPLSQCQFDALVAFTFNVGVTAFETSTMAKLLNNGAYGAAAAQFPKWSHAGGHVSAGLIRRRAAEQALFLSV
jgi:lysozyme